MGFLRPTNVYQETQPLLFVTKLLGLFPIKCCNQMYISYLYVALILFIYYTLLLSVNDYAAGVFKDLHIVTSATKMREIQYYLNVLILPLILIASMYHSSNIKQFYLEIADVDETYKFLNVIVNHEWCMKKDIVHISSVICSTILLNLLDYYSLLDGTRNYMFVIMWILDRFPDFVNTILICSFSILANKITVRFKEVNKMMDSVLKEKTFVMVYGSSQLQDAFRWKVLKDIRIKLGRTVRLVNDAYGFQFIVLSMLLIAQICLHFNIIYAKSYISKDAVDVILSVLWGSFNTLKFAYIIKLYSVLSSNQNA